MITNEEQVRQHTVSREEIDACFARVPSSEGPLDGQTFKVTAKEKGKTERELVTLIFRQGAFLAVQCMQYGFGAGPYTSTDRNNGSIEIECEIPSNEHPDEKHHWTGRVQAGELIGTMVWTDREGNTTKFCYQGRLIGKEE